MNILPRFKGKIINGKFIAEDEFNFQVYMQSLEETEKHCKKDYDFLLSIKPLKGKRTFQHNSFYWTVINPVLTKEMGSESRLKAHQELVWEYLPKGIPMERKSRTGKIYKWSERKKTSEMKVGEFTQFVEWAKDFGALHFGIDWEEFIEESVDEKGQKTYIKKYENI